MAGRRRAPDPLLILLVETNFVLELAFLQEDHERCRALLDLAKERPDHLELTLPASSVVEAYNRQIRRQRERLRSHELAIKKLDRLTRSDPYADAARETWWEISRLFLNSGEEERLRLEAILAHVYASASLIPPDSWVAGNLEGCKASAA